MRDTVVKRHTVGGNTPLTPVVPMSIASNCFATREEWLAAFTSRASEVFDALAYAVPRNIRASIGYTSKGGRGKRIGECHGIAGSADGTFEIFLTPAMGCPILIAATLTHEIVHAVVGLAEGHGKAFKRCATDLGLGGKMTATIPTDAWHSWADPILADLGPAARRSPAAPRRRKGADYPAKEMRMPRMRLRVPHH